MAESEIEGIETYVDELLALPPEQFTEARNAAAKQLRTDGDRAAADAVKRLPRPPLALWGLNRLAHEDGSLIEAFLQAADELRKATSSGGDIRTATGPERAAESRATKAVAAILRREGKGVTDAVERSVGQTLRAAAADPGVAGAVRTGRLIREPAAPSIDDVLSYLALAPPKAKAAASQPAAAKAAAKPAPKPDRSAERRALKERIAAATKDAVAAREEERSASDAAREARGQLRRAEKRATERKVRSDAAEAMLADLRSQLDEL